MAFCFHKHHCLGFPLLIIQVLTLVYKRDQDKEWDKKHKQKHSKEKKRIELELFLPLILGIVLNYPSLLFAHFLSEKVCFWKLLGDNSLTCMGMCKQKEV